MKFVYTALLITAACFFISCGSQRELREPQPRAARYEMLARGKYGTGAEYVYNSSRTAVLCVMNSKPTTQSPQQRVSFFLYDLVADSALIEDNLANGSVAWRDDFSVVVKMVPGIERGDERLSHQRPGYVFDLRNRKMKSLESPEVR